MALIDIDRLPRVRRVFVGRRRELKLFEDAAHAIAPDRAGLLVFHGLGGRGKTWLCEQILKLCRDDPNYASLVVGHLDLHSKPDAAKRDDLMALVYVRNAFAEQKLTFPVFDLALALAWEANRSEEPFPRLRNPWLRKASSAADDITAEGAGDIKDWLSGEEIAGIVGDEVGKLPFVGTLLTRGGRWLFSKAKLAFLHLAHDDLKRLYEGEGRQLRAPAELQRLLPYMLAVDLTRAARDAASRRLVLLIDEYERVFEQAGSAGGLFENRFDAAVRALLGYAEGLLAVFFDREKLPWRHGDPVAALLDGNQHEVLGLSREEAEEHLRAVPVDDETLRGAMIEGALEAGDSVYPLLLELQVEHWAALTGAGETPAPTDFGFDGQAFQPRLAAMVERFLRDYGDPMRATLNRLAYLRRFDRQCYRFVLSEFLTGLPLESYDHLTKLSFVREAGDGWLALHGRVAEALAQMKNEAFATETRKALFAHFDGRAKAASALAVTDAHVEALAEAQAIRHDAVEFSAEYLDWLYTRLTPLRQAARYARCQGFWEDALDFARRTPTTADRAIAAILVNMADLAQSRGRYDEALSLYEQALARSGGDDAELTTALNNMAALLRTRGEYDRALALLKRAATILEKPPGGDSAILAATLANLAGLHQAQGQYGKALPLYRRALPMSERVHGTDSPKLAMLLNNLAGLHRARGSNAKALPLYQRALAIRQAALGPDHPDVGATLNNMALLLDGTGRLDEAHAHYRRALAIRESALGPDHPDVGATLNNLANLLRAKGRADEALALFRRSLEISETTFGPAHREVASTLNNMADLLSDLRRRDEALPLFERAIAIAEAALGPNHPDVATMLNNLAGLRAALGHNTEALALYGRAADILATTFPQGHPDLTLVRRNLEALRNRIN